MPNFNHPTGSFSIGGHAACRTSDVIQIVMDNFVVDHVEIEEIVDSGLLKVYVPGISKDTQIAIHEFLEDKIPMGIRLDVHRTAAPKSCMALPKARKKAPLPKRDPKWK